MDNAATSMYNISTATGEYTYQTQGFLPVQSRPSIVIGDHKWWKEVSLTPESTSLSLVSPTDLHTKMIK